MEREERERREKGLRLFGVRILGEEDEVAAMDEEEVIRKSASMGNLASCAAGLMAVEQGAGDHGYLSDGGLVQSRRRQRRQERKKGVPWTEEEHRTFLAGLAKLGKGDWRGISRNFVTTRTPTQVASHAQKYFLRQKNPNKKKRRSSLFDVVIGDNAAAPEMDPTLSLQKRHEVTNEIKYLHLDSRKVEGSALLKAQVPSRGGEDTSALPPVTNHGGTAIFPSANIMMGISGSSMKGQAVPASSLASPITVPDQVATMVQCTTACAPDFLQLSLPCTNPQAHTSAAAAPPVESSDLELSIAPPQPHGLVNLSPQATAGAISVV